MERKEIPSLAEYFKGVEDPNRFGADIQIVQLARFRRVDAGIWRSFSADRSGQSATGKSSSLAACRALALFSPFNEVIRRLTNSNLWCIKSLKLTRSVCLINK
jgi:hypothetical protein